MNPLPRRTPVSRPTLRTSLRTLFAATVTTALTAGVAVAGVALAAPAHAENRVTPGDFTGYGFDQCLAPTQAKMNRWLKNSPFLAVGIYISGDSRACRSQPNLTPTWVSTQLREGLAAAADHPRPAGLVPAGSRGTAHRRPDDPAESSTNNYAAARRQGVSRGRARRSPPPRALGIVAGQHALVRPRGLRHVNDALPRVRAVRSSARGPGSCTALGYVSGVYSSAGSGIKHARRRPGEPARRSSCPTRSGSPAGTAWPTPSRRTSARRLAPHAA